MNIEVHNHQMSELHEEIQNFCQE